MTDLAPYISFAGNAREALTYYQDVFGGTLILNTLADFNRTDGPADAIAHGMLRGPVTLFGSDATGNDEPVQIRGLLLALLGAADPATLEAWFAKLAATGSDIDQLQLRPWGAHDGQVTDRFGLRWLIGYEV